MCSDGKTALMVASLNGYLSLIKKLISYNADISLKSKVTDSSVLFSFKVTYLFKLIVNDGKLYYSLRKLVLQRAYR